MFLLYAFRSYNYTVVIMSGGLLLMPIVPKHPSYNAVPSSDPQLPRSQSLFQSHPFTSTSKQPKSLKPRKLPMYNGKGTEDF